MFRSLVVCYLVLLRNADASSPTDQEVTVLAPSDSVIEAVPWTVAPESTEVRRPF